MRKTRIKKNVRKVHIKSTRKNMRKSTHIFQIFTEVQENMLKGNQIFVC